MTFDEWKETRHMNGIYWGDLKAAWDAAIEAEREACAKVCETTIPEHERFDDQRAAGNTARKCASSIRMRSNAKDQAEAA